MQHTIRISLLIIIGIILGSMPHNACAAPDCLDNSWHLQQKHDFKEYHLVSQGAHACNHDCYHDPASLMTNDRGYCTVCRHYHVPRPFIIVSQKEQPPVKPAPALEGQKTKKKSHILAHYCLHHH
ncbi:hypothetical protein CVU75_01565 [Candidatus Dependentiae bacterium HGW-Dependentiae-1]|nr:MAG: hypothetical protein CVU75_01565 [Candidatus Dependentiae bacterium HGW-Dependentiae-1]